MVCLTKSGSLRVRQLWEEPKSWVGISGHKRQGLHFQTKFSNTLSQAPLGCPVEGYRFISWKGLEHAGGAQE